jgi:hypothetical protein
LLKTNFYGSDFGLSVLLNPRIVDYQLGLGASNFYGFRVTYNLEN